MTAFTLSQAAIDYAMQNTLTGDDIKTSQAYIAMLSRHIDSGVNATASVMRYGSFDGMEEACLMRGAD